MPYSRVTRDKVDKTLNKLTHSCGKNQVIKLPSALEKMSVNILIDFVAQSTKLEIGESDVV